MAYVRVLLLFSALLYRSLESTPVNHRHGPDNTVVNDDAAAAAGIAEGLKKGSFFIDTTKLKNWKPKKNKALAQSRKLNASASGPDIVKTIHSLVKNISNFHSMKYSATSGGYKGKAQSGYLSASGTAKAAIALTVNRTGAIVKLSLPSGKAHYRGFGATANLSGSAAAYYRNRTLNVGIYGPHASVDLGPVKIGVGTGFGVEGVNHAKEKGGIVNTGIGSFGVKSGCINKICLFGCVSWKVC